MSLNHSDTSVQNLIDEAPMREDLAELPLHENPTIAISQVLIRQAVPIPISDRIKAFLKRLLGE